MKHARRLRHCHHATMTQSMCAMAVLCCTIGVGAPCVVGAYTMPMTLHAAAHACAPRSRAATSPSVMWACRLVKCHDVVASVSVSQHGRRVRRASMSRSAMHDAACSTHASIGRVRSRSAAAAVNANGAAAENDNGAAGAVNDNGAATENDNGAAAENDNGGPASTVVVGCGNAILCGSVAVTRVMMTWMNVLTCARKDGGWVCL
jgi:hypothetical protein